MGLLRYIAILALLSCTSTQVKVATVATDVLISCDIGQTLYASDYGKWDRFSRPGYVIRETNPLLGSTPSLRILIPAWVGAIGITTAIGFLHLPLWLQDTFLGTIGAVESYMVVNNYRFAGVCGIR